MVQLLTFFLYLTISIYFSICVHTRQAVEQQGTDVAIDVVISTQQGVQVVRETGNAFDVCSAIAGAQHGGVVDGEVGEQNTHQHNTEENEENLPADMTGHALMTFRRLQL